MGKNQKVSTREFKEEAVRLAQTSGKSMTQIARELCLSESIVGGKNEGNMDQKHFLGRGIKQR